MEADRRKVLRGALYGVASAGAVAEAMSIDPAFAAAPIARSGMKGLAGLSLEARIDREESARAVTNIMNNYESLLGIGYLQEAYDMFSKRPDAEADVGFGAYVGPEGIKRLYLGLHKIMIGDRRDPASLKPGAQYVLANTTGTVEVALDGRTAKGLWICPGFSTRVDTDEKGSDAIWAWCKRACDFIREDGEWKLWHYKVYGIFYTPYRTPWTETDNSKNLNFSWIPAGLRPDRQTVPAGGTMYDINKAVPADPRPPVPYRTFSETFAYI